MVGVHASNSGWVPSGYATAGTQVAICAGGRSLTSQR